MEVMIRNSKLPAKAGRAELYFIGPDKTPVRDKGLIGLPLHPQAKYFPLRGGEQFLFSTTIIQHDTYRGNSTEEALYFGGTDEEPFLVRLNPDILKNFEEDGESGFFEALKPELIQNMEDTFGWQTQRQGDIFAIRTPFTWKILKTLRALQRSELTATELVATKAQSVFETRHRFTGVGLQVNLGSNAGTHSFVEGVLSAPDHADLALKGIFVLAQSTGLFNPRLAD